jgi:ribonuclease III
MTPQRRRQLVAFLRRLGVDPTAANGPGDGADALAPIEEALSHSSAGLARNHERLEFLGDAVLRLAAAEVLQRAHPSLSVGQCSTLRAQLVSDRWLAELAESCDLAAVLHLGPMAAGDRAGRATVLAEICEALVGGIYTAWGAGSGGLAAVEAWLAPHWQRAAAELLADPHRHNWKSALQEWSQGRGLGLPCYTCEERSLTHGDPRRFHCTVDVTSREASGPIGEGWGGSRRDAEQQAARQALVSLGMLSPAPAS